MPPGPKAGFSPGERVILRSSRECGIVICAWEDTDIGELDYYIAFFGESFPKDGKKPARIPYVLRYSATSLEPALGDGLIKGAPGPHGSVQPKAGETGYREDER